MGNSYSVRNSENLEVLIWDADEGVCFDWFNWLVFD